MRNPDPLYSSGIFISGRFRAPWRSVAALHKRPKKAKEVSAKGRGNHGNDRNFNDESLAESQGFLQEYPTVSQTEERSDGGEAMCERCVIRKEVARGKKARKKTARVRISGKQEKRKKSLRIQKNKLIKLRDIYNYWLTFEKTTEMRRK